ncbi:MAG: DUF6089 family protein [Crocinitomicaceae bacterium]|nr:DUF6089 family protein [Crocinitomicaceae bacterium]MDG1776580.1 DUF6089 family protein [Crocinitomicaceae bacterium]
MKYIIALLVLSITTASFGQRHTNTSKSELGFLVGGTYYLGDLNQFVPFKNTHLAGGLVYRYNVHSRLSLRANIMYGKVSASDAASNSEFQQERNLSFSSEIYEAGIGVEFNYFPFQLGHDRYKGTAYLLAELAVFRMNPKASYNGSEVALRDLGTEGQGTSLNSKSYYNLTQLSIPLGVGAKLSLGDRVGLNVECGIRKTFTDYLDDVGANAYVDPVVLAAENGPLSAELSNLSGNQYGQRGNTLTKDWYVFTGMMITFRLGKPATCFYQDN